MLACGLAASSCAEAAPKFFTFLTEDREVEERTLNAREIVLNESFFMLVGWACPS